MKKKDIERLLKSEIEQNVPDVLSNVLSTPITKEKVVEEKVVEKKPYFQFRYLYVSLAMCAVLVIGIGFLLPSIREYAYTTPNTTTENYTITTELAVGENTAKVSSDSLNKVTSIEVNEQSLSLVGVSNLDDALEVVVSYLEGLNAFDGVAQVTLKVEASISKHSDACYGVVKTNLNTIFTEKNIDCGIVKD